LLKDWAKLTRQGQKMDITPDTLPELAKHLVMERKRQGLSRAQAASVCNVSTSFIRDAELDPGRCSLARLQQLIRGLGLTLTVTGWQLSGRTADAEPTPTTPTTSTTAPTPMLKTLSNA
jgi:ribosome-binding protein aMBF1 (putative translation factor)